MILRIYPGSSRKNAMFDEWCPWENPDGSRAHKVSCLMSLNLNLNPGFNKYCRAVCFDCTVWASYKHFYWNVLWCSGPSLNKREYLKKHLSGNDHFIAKMMFLRTLSTLSFPKGEISLRSKSQKTLSSFLTSAFYLPYE